MPRDRKRKRSRTANEVESPKMSGETSSEDLVQGFGSCALFPAQRHWHPPLRFPLPSHVNIKQESSDVESDDSTETVIRGETNSHTFHQNSSPSHIGIKSEPLEGDDSSNTQANTDVTQNGGPSVSTPPVEATEEKQQLFKKSCLTPIPSDSSSNFQSTEEIKESNNSLPDADRNGDIIHKKFKTELSDSVPTTTVKESESPVKVHTSPKPPNSLNDSHESKEQGNLTPISSPCVQSSTNGLIRRNIKKELLSPERNESSHHRVVASPGNGVASSMCSSGYSKQPSPPKSVPNLKSSLCDPGITFPMDCVQYLSLNASFNLEDIKDCIKKLSAKYLSGANLEDVHASSNSAENVSPISIITNLKKEKCVTPMSLNNNALEPCLNMPSSFETISKDTSEDLNSIVLETPCSKNKQFYLGKNPMESPKSINFSENALHLENGSNYLSSAATSHDKNVLNVERIQVESQKLSNSSEDASNKFIHKESTSKKYSSFSTEKLNEILRNAGSAIFSSPPLSDESSKVNNDGYSVSSEDLSPVQIHTIGSSVDSQKRQAPEEIDVQNLEENNTFIKSKKLKLASFSKNIFRKEGPPLSETAHSKSSESAALKNVNHRNSSESKELPAKKIKIVDYQNNRHKLRTQPTTFMEQNVEDMKEPSTRSPLASCYSSPDRVRPSTSSVYDSSKQSVGRNQKPTGDTNSLSDAILRDPRLRKIAASIISPAPQTVIARMILPVLSSSKEVMKTKVQNHASPSHDTGTTQKYHCHEDFIRNTGRRSDSSATSSSYSPASDTPGSSKLHRSQTITDGREPLTAGMIHPVLSSSKEVVTKSKVQSLRSPSHDTGRTRKSYHCHDDSIKNHTGHRLDSSAASSPHSHASNTPGSSRLRNSQSFTNAREPPTKTGKKIVSAQELSFRIIGWNAMWIQQMENGRNPPIFKETKKVVQNNYENFTEYYDTYYGLHLLNIWLDIYESWEKSSLSFSAEFEDYEDRTFHYKNFFSASMRTTDMPINQGIVHIQCITEKGDEQCLFGFVYDVKQRPFPREPKGWKDVKFSFYTVEKLGAKLKSTVHFRKLSRVRVAIKQLSSLESFIASPMKDVILNPKGQSQQIEVVDIPSTVIPGTELQVWVKKIIECSTSPNNRFTLVNQQVDANPLTILSLVRGFLPTRSTVLVCLRDTKRCFEMAECLSYGFVLALKESEVSDIPEKYKEFTLRANAAKLNGRSMEAELEVLKSAKIILTVTSRIFLGDNKNATLGQKLTVIIEQSNMCTELETALPLGYGPENVVLLGNPKTSPDLHPHLKLRDYHRTLFHRLYCGKRSQRNMKM